ncbi:unnamed protein product [Litomosoides sigmodontis]|uniref:Uncharacterized protein n=1 Tax=Litomosoides sigmodontis TaxID=42156 RepID=A0A3P6TC63_LITSI|nr:unnamed protein product [Litomosoides sigmodontis]
MVVNEETIIRMTDETVNAKSQTPICLNIVRNAQLNVAEELRKQQLEVQRVDAALSFLEEMESNELEEDVSLDEPCEFGSLRVVREELNQYVDLVRHLMSLTKQCHTNSSKQESANDTSVEKARDDCDIRIELGCSNAMPGQSLIDLRTSRLAIIPTTTVHIASRLTDAVPKCGNDSSLHIKSKEMLVDARQSVQNQRIHSASEPGSLLQLVQPTPVTTVTTNQKPHPFLSQAGSYSHSLHAAMQNVLGSLKRTLPGFHPIASTILNSDVNDFISAFSVALRRYDDRVRSQIKLLLEKYDSSSNSSKRSELVCEIDHLHKISRAASNKREQLLDIIHGPYYQAVNCPPLRQMKILHSTFSSNSS